METKDDLALLRERAVALRLAGKSVREIREILGPVGKRALSAALKGTPPADWTLRPNAKDDLRERARELRAQGLKYKEIAAALHVSLSSVSLWVRDMPHPPRITDAEAKRRTAEGSHRYWARERQLRAARRAEEIATSCAEIGPLTDREVLIAGAIAYWCEGSKAKPFERVIFVNSDPGLIRFFLRFLAVVGVQLDELAFCVQIHETADVTQAQQFWQDVTGASSEQFTKPAIKRHDPKTNRKNTGEGYHGCLRVSVYRGSYLYRKIEGWVSAITTAALPLGWLAFVPTPVLPGKDSNLRKSDQNRLSCLARRPGTVPTTVPGTGTVPRNLNVRLGKRSVVACLGDPPWG